MRTRHARYVGALLSAIALTNAPAAYAQINGEGSWESTAPMATGRAGHTATLLDGPECKTSSAPRYCGDVLVVGGTTNDPADPFAHPPTRSSELFDARTGTWESVGRLNSARWSHTATLLPDGKVLVTGGRSTRLVPCDPSEPGMMCPQEVSLRSAELYDPARGTWSSCSEAGQRPSSSCPGAMSGDGRDAHTATLLSGAACGADCGKVLIVGGPEAFTDPTGGPANPTAELYDPQTGTFTRAGELMQPRYQHSATLLASGKVLVVGGTFPPGSEPGSPPGPGRGPETGEAKVSSELYDPRTRTWTSCSFFKPPASPRPTTRDCPGDLVQSRADHSATLLPDGSLLATGGASNDEIRITAERYDAATGVWRLTTRLNQRRSGHGAALLPNGKVLAAGGRGPGFFNAIASAELYDPAIAAARWRLAPFMSDPRGSDFTHPRSVPAVLLSSDAAAFRADARICGANCGKVLVVGGEDESLNRRLASAELYTPAPVLRPGAGSAAASADTAASATPSDGGPPSSSSRGPLAPACRKSTTKLALARTTFDRSDRSISLLAPITRLASGSARVTLRAAGRTTTFTAPIDSTRGRVRVSHAITAAQARLGTGILTIRYAGDADTRPLTVRVRAANTPARMRATRPTITSGGFLRADGTISPRARGVVRVKLEYVSRSDGRTVVLQRTAAIRAGRWRLNRKLSPAILAQIAQRCGTLHSYTVFTGYMREDMRGEQRSLQVLPAP